MTADEVIALLAMQPHPEGGHYVETHRAPGPSGERSAVSLIYFLLRQGEISRWHRVDATEIWHWYGGAPLILRLSHDGVGEETITLGNDLFGGERPQAVVPPGAWQSACPTGSWTLVGCTVSPAFTFEGFVMAPLGWGPGPGGSPP